MVSKRWTNSTSNQPINRPSVYPSVRLAGRTIPNGARASMPRKQYWSNGCITGWPVGGGGRWLWGLLRHWGWPGPNPRTSFITGLTEGAVIRVPLSRLVSRAAPLSASAVALRFSPFLRLFLSSWFRLFALTPPLSRLRCLAVCLSLGYSLLFANSGSDYRRFTLDRQPSFYLSALASLTRAVNEIYAEDINRHSLRSR